jgi:hypothetical protein
LDDLTRRVGVYNFMEARAAALPPLFHANRESRTEGFKTAAALGRLMTINKTDPTGLERTFYFDYERDTLLFTERLAPSFSSCSLPLSYQELYSETEATYHPPFSIPLYYLRLVGELFSSRASKSWPGFLSIPTRLLRGRDLSTLAD